MIKEINSPRLKSPLFIAAWPGMGEVAYRGALFLKEVMGFKMFAKLEAGRFFKPAAVVVEKGIINLPAIPAGFFYYVIIISAWVISHRRPRASGYRSSIHTPRVSAITVSDSVVYADTSKNEDTWCGVLRHYDAEDRRTPADNPEIALGFKGW